MEKETELQVSRKSGDNGGVKLKPLQPLPLGGKVLFKLPQPDADDDDDDTNDCISLKEWQPSEMIASSTDARRLSFSAWKPVKETDTFSKGSVHSRPSGYTPLVQNNGDVCLPTSIHGDAHPKLPSEEIDEGEDQQEDDHGNGTYESGLEDDLEDESEVESTNHVTEPEDTDNRPKVSHHHHSISLANGIAPPPTQAKGGIAFDITLDDHESSSQSRRSTGSSRGSSLRVSFINEVMLDSPSPPRHANKSPFRSRPNDTKSPAKSRPSWESSTKIGKSAPPMPKKFVRPTLHGIKVKKGQGGVAKTAMRASTSSIETENGFHAREARPREAVARSWDSQYCGGGEYDSVSQLISKSLVSSTKDNNKEDSNGNGFSSKPERPSLSLPLPRSNGVQKHDLQNGEEDLKPALSGGGGVTETNKLAGDFGKLFSKLRRASAPLPKPPSKQQQPAVHPKPSPAPSLGKISRANSAPVENPKSTTKKSLAPLHSLDSSGGNQKYAIGSYASLKLLQECAQTEKITPTPAYNTHKPRKIRDHEPHRHYYKTISKTLDSKLKA